ncbi:HNH endonuclease [Curtobacterium sp. MCSS17_015]|uniref:HNH endonuclease n=1 Tax=Curtobacterium sp. MCSS17_015 TaxID=2175666 RepID=UPI0011B76504|nr:HNH endonuclease [Curtobacterium sp. MCSS17_015]WIB25858.1 hypothetical protein DEJ18_12480 [Curtobacterium sp. MCSS17_015]
MPFASRTARNAYYRQWRANRRQAWIAEQGGCCASCGSVSQLEVDHVDPTRKSLNVRDVWSLSAHRRNAELVKCQVLCHDCHARKTNPPPDLTHGTNSGYKTRGCRCDACTAWNRERVRQQRARRAA